MTGQESMTISEQVERAISAWLGWLPTWRPPAHRGRARVCRRCTGSPVLAAAGLARSAPHQVGHALNIRLQRIIDTEVERFTAANLLLLHEELLNDALVNGGAAAQADLPPELDGLDLDPEPDDGQPFLFTLAELAVDLAPVVSPEPRAPLTAAEKAQLIREIEQADQFADALGQEICFLVLENQQRITQAVGRFVEPQIQALLDTLTWELDPPREL